MMCSGDDIWEKKMVRVCLIFLLVLVRSRELCRRGLHLSIWRRSGRLGGRGNEGWKGLLMRGEGLEVLRKSCEMIRSTKENLKTREAQSEMLDTGR
jgi:hypothetical protein